MITKILCFFLLFFLPHGICAEQREAADNRVNAISEYNLAIKIIPEAHRLEVMGELILPPFSEARKSLELYLSDTMHDLEVEILEPKALAGKAQIEKKAIEKSAVIWDLQPPEPFPAEEPIHLRFSHTGGNGTRFVFYIGEEGSFASSWNTFWYPMLIGYGRCTGKMIFSVPVGYSVIATGKRISLAEQEASGSFVFNIAQPSLLTFAAAKYVVERHTDARGNIFSAYLLKPRKHIGEYLEKCMKVMNVLTQEFGPNPSGDFALVETPGKQSRRAGFWGAGAEGLILAMDTFLDRDFNTAFYGHEIAHQWWGASVVQKGSRGAFMLNEGMAQYGSLRAVEILDGPDMAERFRRTGYPGYVPESNSKEYFKIEAKGFDQPLSSLSNDGYGRLIADSKGFIVFDMLSRTLGRDKFRHMLQDIVRKCAVDEISWDEFLDEIEKGSSMNLRWFYDQWFDRKGAPRWKLNWRQEGDTICGTILQQQPYFRADVEVLIEGGSGQKLLRTVELRSDKTEFSFPADFRARSLIVDPHFLVLHHAP
jgi:hypothetical protein